MSRETFTCHGCWVDFPVGQAHDIDACLAGMKAAAETERQRYEAALPCCKDRDGHGHKGCRHAVLQRGLAAPRKDCAGYCTACVPPMKVTEQQEAAAAAIHRSMRATRTPWEQMTRQGQDSYRKAAKAALKAAGSVPA